MELKALKLDELKVLATENNVEVKGKVTKRKLVAELSKALDSEAEDVVTLDETAESEPAIEATETEVVEAKVLDWSTIKSVNARSIAKIEDRDFLLTFKGFELVSDDARTHAESLSLTDLQACVVAMNKKMKKDADPKNVEQRKNFNESFALIDGLTEMFTKKLDKAAIAEIKDFMSEKSFKRADRKEINTLVENNRLKLGSRKELDYASEWYQFAEASIDRENRVVEYKDAEGNDAQVSIAEYCVDVYLRDFNTKYAQNILDVVSGGEYDLYATNYNKYTVYNKKMLVEAIGDNDLVFLDALQQNYDSARMAMDHDMIWGEFELESNIVLINHLNAEEKAVVEESYPLEVNGHCVHSKLFRVK
jgi:hypothetical protein